uniref:Sodium-coupled monocarboxylate transporter 1 n=1 Tax=Timema genevievae TaxID=629358 RepID=A0A7R9JZK9_TIMGE|nr:unnamed protein product [Timema genevievae]
MSVDAAGSVHVEFAAHSSPVLLTPLGNTQQSTNLWRLSNVLNSGVNEQGHMAFRVFILVFSSTCTMNSVGGLKAVVWSDTLQLILMFGGVIVVMILGTIKIGGPEVVFQRSEQSGRLEFFNLDLDPTVRHTFWSVTIGNYFSWLSSSAVNQAMVQRCLALPNITKANYTIVILTIGIACIVSMSCYTGLLIYATFADCDPVSARLIRKADQLLPYYVMELSEHVPGLPGLFVAGVFSAALSTMSTGLNSMTGVIFEDLIRPMYKGPISESTASLIMKIVVVIIGTCCVGLVFLVDKLGTIVQAVKSLTGIASGSLLGIFSLGMFFPWANPKGAIAGGIVSVAFVGWISLGTQAAIARKQITFPTKPVSIEGCLHLVNITMDPVPTSREDVFFLYRMSYLWYSIIGTLTAIIVGLIVSFMTGPRDPKSIDPDLLSPVIHRFLPRMTNKFSRDQEHQQKDGTEMQQRTSLPKYELKKC